MKFQLDAFNLNRGLNDIFLEFESKIPHIYKLSELYLDNSNPHKKFKRRFLFSRRSLGFFKSFLITLFKSYLSKRHNEEIKCDVLLVSPYVDKSKKQNFFYGDLETYFHNLKKSTADLRIYNGDSSLKNYFKEQDDPALNIFYLPCLSLKDNLSVLGDLVKTFKDISTAIKKEKDIEKKELLHLIKNRIFSRTNFFTFYFSTQLDIFMQKGKFKLALVTFDGSPWERVFCKKFKIFCKKGRVAFYQHAPITKKSYSLFNKYPSSLNPDQIFCSGKIPNKIFSEEISFPTHITVLGSRKYQKRFKEQNINKEDSILFVTQGSKKDIFTLYRLAIKLAFHQRKMKVKVLLHPAASLSISFKVLNKLFELFLSNFLCLSSSDENMFSKSKFMIYFSSSLSIEKMTHDIRPVHLANTTNINPLDALVNKENPTLSWCTQAKNLDDILNLIDIDSNLDSMMGVYSRQKAKNFSKEYFEPFQLSKEIIAD